MPRPTLGKKPMTATERQRRRRKRLQQAESAIIRDKRRSRAREREAQHYIPTPPGITYWEQVAVATDAGPRTILSPKTRPLAACSKMLTNDDVRSLLIQLMEMARQRGIAINPS